MALPDLTPEFSYGCLNELQIHLLCVAVCSTVRRRPAVFFSRNRADAHDYSWTAEATALRFPKRAYLTYFYSEEATGIRSAVLYAQRLSWTPQRRKLISNQRCLRI
jgi:hypothetical protein